MASKNHTANLLDIQNDDTEINLQFQDFEGITTSTSRDDVYKGQTIYFNSFPDSADDDQEQKLLGDEEGESRPKPTHSFWTFEYYQQFFDVESKQVGDRIIWSMVPKPGVNYLQSYIRPNPDLYGPFWICITLVFTTAIAGNLSNYLQTTHSYKWRYDFHKVTLATSSIFSYAWLVPLVIWSVLLWRGSKASISLLELICLYGYSLAVFVPVSLLWMIPLRWLQWCLGIVASVLSGSVLVRTIQPAISHEAKKIALGLAVFILVLHAALALGFMLYFFYPPTTNTGNMSITEAALVNKSNVSESLSANEKEKDLPKNQARSEESKESAAKVDVDKEKEILERENRIVNKGETPNSDKPTRESKSSPNQQEISKQNLAIKKKDTSKTETEEKNSIVGKGNKNVATEKISKTPTDKTETKILTGPKDPVNSTLAS